MRTKYIIALLLIAAVCIQSCQNNTKEASSGADEKDVDVVEQPISNDRLLISSGGGARGAWGVGLVQALIKKNKNGYKVVFGTSTGSLMGPYILLGSYDPKYLDELEKVYTNVTQYDIFDRPSPFKVWVDAEGDVHQKLNDAVVLGRLATNKLTVGTTFPLWNLIQKGFKDHHLKMIKDHNQKLCVGVVDMVTGEHHIVSSDQVKNAEQMGDWIWASSNQPVFMSYLVDTLPGDSVQGYFVDGGLRNVIPIIEGMKYAADNGIPNVDVIINNGRRTVENDWSPYDKPIKIFEGLFRVLKVYGANTMAHDTLIGGLMRDFHNCQARCGASPEEHKDAKEQRKIPNSKNITITLNMYFMDDTTAEKYTADLAFFPEPMKALVEEGKNHFSTHPDNTGVITFKINSHEFQETFEEFYAPK